MEKVSLEGEVPRQPPDISRTLALAAALNSRQWEEPFVAKRNWKAKAKKEVEDIMREMADDGTGNGEDGDESSDEEMDDDGRVGTEEDEDEDGDEDAEEPVWPKGVTGLI